MCVCMYFCEDSRHLGTTQMNRWFSCLEGYHFLTVVHAHSHCVSAVRLSILADDAAVVPRSSFRAAKLQITNGLENTLSPPLTFILGQK